MSYNAEDLERLLYGACKNLVDNGIALGPQQETFYLKRRAEDTSHGRELWEQIPAVDRYTIAKYLQTGAVSGLIADPKTSLSGNSIGENDVQATSGLAVPVDPDDRDGDVRISG
jgi:hypothetical protein